MNSNLQQVLLLLSFKTLCLYQDSVEEGRLELLTLSSVRECKVIKHAKVRDWYWYWSRYLKFLTHKSFGCSPRVSPWN